MGTTFEILSNPQLWYIVIFAIVFLFASTATRSKDASIPTSISLIQTRFIHRCFLSVTVVGLLIAIGNYVINPLGLYSTTLTPPVTSTSHRDKLERWNALKSPPEIVILGSSRSVTAPVKVLQQETGKSVFNASVYGGSPRDYIAFLRYAIFHKQLPKFFIVGLGIEQVSEDVNVFFEPMDSLAQYVQDSPSEALKRVRYLLDIGQTQATFKSLVSRVMLGETNTGNPFDVDGFRSFPDKPVFELAVDENIAGAYIRTGNLNATQILHLEDFLELCREQNIYVIFYMPPYQPRLLKAYEESPGYLPSQARLEEILSNLRQKYDFAFFDLTHIESVSGTPDMFVDGIHPKPEAQLLILDFILRNTPQLNGTHAF